MVIAVAVGHGKAVVEKRHVELAGLEDARDFLIVVGRHCVIARCWMTPGPRQVRAVLRLQEAHHHHLPRHCSFSIIDDFARTCRTPVIGRIQARRSAYVSSRSAARPYWLASARNFSQVASST